MTWEQFLETERAKTELNIADIGSRSDFQVCNDGSLEDLELQTKAFWETQLKPLVEKTKKNP